jgi:hypothetical protein
LPFLILCPACLQRLDVASIDPVQAGAGEVLCTCVRCGARLKRDPHSRVIPTEVCAPKMFAISRASRRAVVCRERGDTVRIRARGWAGWLFGKRVTVTPDHVDVRQYLRPSIRKVVPIGHARGVVVVQHLLLRPVDAMWATYLMVDDLALPLAALSELDHAIDHASAINLALMARKPAGDPYRGLLPAATE